MSGPWERDPFPDFPLPTTPDAEPPDFKLGPFLLAGVPILVPMRPGKGNLRGEGA